MGLDNVGNISGQFNMTVEDINNAQDISTDFIQKMGGAGYDMDDIMDTLAVAFTFNREVLGSQEQVPETLNLYEQLRGAGIDHNQALSTSIMGGDPDNYRPDSGPAPLATGPKEFDI